MTMKRNGKKLKVLPDGHPRRMSDGKNAWRKMDDEQRREFLHWIFEDSPVVALGRICGDELTAYYENGYVYVEDPKARNENMIEKLEAGESVSLGELLAQDQAPDAADPGNR